ncbi:MAG: carbamoyl-phosphate synthase (glutamine-hydrolyzing) large subunit, partial [Candidatus Levybacteria bacterium]|nr:carbamoyl-phosphate synthase (glutamine-hydrolyzing) large subunit [Candidatus Levybacteria bacterium]
EFDYSGSQAIKALKEEGIKTVLVNPNIATIQTSRFLADTVYFLPVNEYFVEKIIEKESPDGILLSFGGQTALNCGIALYKNGVLKKHNVEILGTPISAILLTEDRKKFADHLKKIDIPIPLSKTATSIKQAIKIAEGVGYPVMVRAGFALGGQGSGIAKNEKELVTILDQSFSFVSQVLIEKYLHHYKEVEYEVVRDKDDNCITVCNMENMDPLGIHTGESIVVAPSQTLNNFEYHKLREASIKIVRSLGIVGECNVQFALNPRPQRQQAGLRGGRAKSNDEPDFDYYVIEVNARLSRSSALASKATGYPLAYVAAKLALGKNLTEIKNKVTQVTTSCFEPSLDYIVVKIPRWDIEKFRGADEKIGSSMKSVGEVMGIGRTFEEACQKAVRMLDLDLEGPTSDRILINDSTSLKNITSLLSTPTPKRMFALCQALKRNMPIKKIYDLTGIDPWFIERIKNIVEKERKLEKLYSSSDPEPVEGELRSNKVDSSRLRSNNKTLLTKEFLLELKKLGFSDKRIGQVLGVKGLEIRKLRLKLDIKPYVFQIDTLAGEFPAKTNYLYLTYNGNHNDIDPIEKNGVIVLGSGPYRIGSSVEFDWTSVSTVLSLKEHNKKSIIINCNPETVSTDYDISDRLYFEELTFERIADIYEFENPLGIIVSVGGQTPNNRARALKSHGFNILGTDPNDIDRAEDRSKFSALLDSLGVDQPAWNKFADNDSAVEFCEKVGYPVLIRPSFVLSGTSMNICHNKDELIYYLEKALHVSKKYPITVSKFIEEAKEIELDAVSQKGKIISFVISEHIENAGVHSGDATIVLPAQKVYLETQRKIIDIGKKLSRALKITGPFNVQFLAKDNNVSVIEINLRSSRTFPFISKVTGVDFIKLAVNAFFNQAVFSNTFNSPGDNLNFVATKVPQFSYSRLTGADPVIHVEMGSTGEVACFGQDLEEAFLKGEISVGTRIPEKGIFISLGGDENKLEFLESARLLQKLKLELFATEKTARFLNKNGIKTKRLYKIHEKKSPNILDFFQKGKIDLAINLVDLNFKKDLSDEYQIRRSAVDHNIPIFTNIKKAELFIKAIATKKPEDLYIKSWNEYVPS